MCDRYSCRTMRPAFTCPRPAASKPPAGPVLEPASGLSASARQPPSRARDTPTRGPTMTTNGKVVINLATGLEDPERVTVAFLVAGAAAQAGKHVTMFLTKEAVR